MPPGEAPAPTAPDRQCHRFAAPPGASFPTHPKAGQSAGDANRVGLSNPLKRPAGATKDAFHAQIGDRYDMAELAREA